MLNKPYFDDLETRSDDARQADIAKALPAQIARAKGVAGYGGALDAIDPARITDAAALARLPVLRKSELGRAQAANAPFGGFTTKPPSEFGHIFQSPGPIYEPSSNAHDWWRMGRFLHAVGVGKGDIVQNCFGYHLTPAGMIFESGARAVGATVLPAGTGQTELQVTAARDIGSTAYAGTPDYLKVILDKAEEMGVSLKIAKAAVGGGALFPSLRAEYADRGIACLQSYATADLGNIAYESAAMEGMIIDEHVIVEIVTPGTGDPANLTIGDCGLDEMLNEMRSQMNRFIEENVAPHAHEWHCNNEYVPLEIIQKLAELGVFALTLPEEYDGMGLGKESMCLVSEELSRGWIAIGSLGTRPEIIRLSRIIPALGNGPHAVAEDFPMAQFGGEGAPAFGQIGVASESGRAV